MHVCTSEVVRKMASRRGLEPLTPGLGNTCPRVERRDTIGQATIFYRILLLALSRNVL
jgi:hypothetical protein